MDFCIYSVSVTLYEDDNQGLLRWVYDLGLLEINVLKVIKINHKEKQRGCPLLGANRYTHIYVSYICVYILFICLRL